MESRRLRSLDVRAVWTNGKGLLVLTPKAEQAEAVLRAVRAAHPYEEPVIHFLPLYEPGVER
ncbi:hypothetical protein ACFVX9_22325 [Kitasatospora sp. NPDC058243]|uniref:hypothetical protein n=1 Tax=Kitasatospora sp. NPDC058243 TaxID=3346397 RepID=UPI0036DDB422